MSEVQRVYRHDLVDEVALLEHAQSVEDAWTDQPIRISLGVVEMPDAAEVRVAQVALVEDPGARGGVLERQPAHDRADPRALGCVGQHRVGVLERVRGLDEDRPVDAGRRELRLELVRGERAVIGPYSGTSHGYSTRSRSQRCW